VHDLVTMQIFQALQDLPRDLRQESLRHHVGSPLLQRASIHVLQYEVDLFALFKDPVAFHDIRRLCLLQNLHLSDYLPPHSLIGIAMNDLQGVKCRSLSVFDLVHVTPAAMAEHLNSLQVREIRHIFGDSCTLHLRRQRESIQLSLLASRDWDIEPRIFPTRHFLQSKN